MQHKTKPGNRAGKFYSPEEVKMYNSGPSTSVLAATGGFAASSLLGWAFVLLVATGVALLIAARFVAQRRRTRLLQK